VDQVVQHFSANGSVDYLSHVFGITKETRVSFVRVSAAEPLIQVRMQLLGKVTRALGFAVEPMILKATKEFFRDLCRECEEAS